MQLHRRTLCPTGHIAANSTDLSAIPPQVLAQYEPFFPPDGLCASGHAPGFSEAAFEWNGTATGQAQFVCRYRGQLALRDTLVVGRDPMLDQAAIDVLAGDLAGRGVLNLPREDWPAPLGALVTHSARPLLVGAVWPALSVEEPGRIASLNILLAAVYLRRLGKAVGQVVESIARPAD